MLTQQAQQAQQTGQTGQTGGQQAASACGTTALRPLRRQELVFIGLGLGAEAVE